MKKQKTLNIIVIILVALFIFYAGSRLKQTQENTIPTSFEIPKYAERGSYLVGTQSLIIENEKELEITLWYPAKSTTSASADITYAYEIKMGEPLGFVTIASFDGQAISNAAYDLSDGPYPLVILSPGFSIGSAAYAWLGEHLASYGFVVVSPDHQEHLNPEDQLWRSAIARPQDILSVLLYLDEQVNPGGQYEGLINTEIAAVVGHSYGGYTTLAAGGAQIDMAYLHSHCENAINEEHAAAWICEILLSHQAEMAELAGQDPNTTDLWPAWADPRVDAIVSIAGDAFFFGPDGLAKIDIPVMAISGTADQDSPFSWSAQPVYDYASSQNKTLIAFQGVEHMEFTAECEAIPFYFKLLSGEFCADASLDRAYIHALTKHFTTAFLLSELMEDLEAAAVLNPENVEFIGVLYQAQGFDK